MVKTLATPLLKLSPNSLRSTGTIGIRHLFSNIINSPVMKPQTYKYWLAGSHFHPPCGWPQATDLFFYCPLLFKVKKNLKLFLFLNCLTAGSRWFLVPLLLSIWQHLFSPKKGAWPFLRQGTGSVLVWKKSAVFETDVNNARCKIFKTLRCEGKFAYCKCFLRNEMNTGTFHTQNNPCSVVLVS